MAAPSSISGDELLALLKDPSGLAAQIEHYTQVKADAESKLRAVVDEATANEFKEQAAKLKKTAEDLLEQANVRAAQIVKDATDQAQKVRDDADAYASRVTAEANSASAGVRASAQSVLDSARAMESKNNDLKGQLETQLQRAQAAEQAHTKAKAEHEAAHADLSSRSERLTQILEQVKQIAP